MTRGLIVFAREPRPGSVKTRLAAVLGEQTAAELYERMVRDVLAGCAHLDGVTATVYWAAADDALPRMSAEYGSVSRLQPPGDLGERMAGAFQEMFADGIDQCCIIGSDAPDLPAEYLASAFALLDGDDVDVVYGPCVDGGYYLLGMKKMWPELFHGIAWSSAQVLVQSLAAAQRLQLSVRLLPEWRDIDTIEDLHAYRERQRAKEIV